MASLGVLTGAFLMAAFLGAGDFFTAVDLTGGVGAAVVVFLFFFVGGLDLEFPAFSLGAAGVTGLFFFFASCFLFFSISSS